MRPGTGRLCQCPWHRHAAQRHAEAQAINRWAGDHAARHPGELHQSQHRPSAGRGGAVEAVVCLMALREAMAPADRRRVRTPDPLCRFPLVHKPVEAQSRLRPDQLVRVRRSQRLPGPEEVGMNSVFVHGLRRRLCRRAGVSPLAPGGSRRPASARATDTPPRLAGSA